MVKSRGESGHPCLTPFPLDQYGKSFNTGGRPLPSVRLLTFVRYRSSVSTRLSGKKVSGSRVADSSGPSTCPQADCQPLPTHSLDLGCCPFISLFHSDVFSDHTLPLAEGCVQVATLFSARIPF
ncbi:hypothetical protein EVAR_2402_1 [Eumeta japonica]|uniref:Uncharacterized protein n=1 Tax=Eumeta variegata TaxID=151549 RepID=A0A4C1SQQ2_EUMVA|nr:hypothetical protein EVAR_2402_1 [Eumeta japonica]